MAESSAGRKNRLWAALVLALLCTHAGLARSQAAPKAYGKWWTTCDNGGACTVIGAGGGGGVGLSLILRRGAEPQAPLRATLIADTPQMPTGAANWRVSIDGRQVATVRARADDVMMGDFAAGDMAALAVRLIAGQELRIEGMGAASLSLAGVQDALRRMDESQGRAGTTTALVAKGSRPAATIPPAPPLPRITATAARISWQKEPPKGARGDVRACRKAFKGGTGDRQLRAFEMEGGAILWIIPCGRRGEVDYDLVLVSRGNGDKVRPALLSDLTPSKMPSGVRSNVRFDPAAGLLGEVASERGLPDCGRASQWVWNDGKFIRVREREMPECVGLPLELWPDTYRTVVRRGG